MNHTKTFMLMALMTALFIGVGFLLAGTGGALIAFVVAACMNFYSYWNSGDAVLSMYNAREVDQHSAPEYYDIVRQLAERANLPMPRVFIIDTPQPNAFATGRNPQNAAVAASTGLLQALNKQEIAAVMAHELAHVEHRDTLTMTMTATLAGAISMLANFAMFFGGNRNNSLGIVGVIATMILAPLAASLVQMAVSRTREYAADKRGAEICGNPQWLASALDKIARGAKQVVNEQAEHNPASAHLFIINPLADTARDNLFSTHPDTDNRIAALKELARQWGSGWQQTSREMPQQRQEQSFSGPWGSSSPGANSRAKRDDGTYGDEPPQRGPWG